MRSLDDLGPGDWWYSLRYECPPWGYRGAWGPSCSWTTRDGRLVERSWYTLDTTRVIYDVTTFWRSGAVLHFERRNTLRQAWSPFELFEEFFTRSGSLLACMYAKLDEKGQQFSAYFWAGKPVTQKQFRDKTLELYDYVHSRGKL